MLNGAAIFHSSLSLLNQRLAVFALISIPFFVRLMPNARLHHSPGMKTISWPVSGERGLYGISPGATERSIHTDELIGITAFLFDVEVYPGFITFLEPLKILRIQ